MHPSREKKINDNIKDQLLSDTCSDHVTEYNIKIPCPLAARIETFANENNTSFATVIIEAIDTFLRKQKTP
jgi:hypothetical protein